MVYYLLVRAYVGFCMHAWVCRWEIICVWRFSFNAMHVVTGEYAKPISVVTWSNPDLHFKWNFLGRFWAWSSSS